MGFLKFLKKRERKDGLNELDLPPAPPALEGFDEDIHFPEISELEGKKIEMPEFDFPEDKIQSQESKELMADFPSFYPMQEKPSSIPTISMPTLADKPPLPPFEQMPEIEEQDIPSPPLVPKEKPTLTHEKKDPIALIGGSLYIKVDKFKIALGSINVVRNDLRKTEESLIKFEETKKMEETSMNKIKSSLDDLQKKLVFVDKILFEGE